MATPFRSHASQSAEDSTRVSAKSRSTRRRREAPIPDGWVDTRQLCYDFSPAFHLPAGGSWRVCARWIEPEAGETSAFIEFCFEGYEKGKWCHLETPFRFPLFYQVGSCCVLPKEEEEETEARFEKWNQKVISSARRNKKRGRNSGREGPNPAVTRPRNQPRAPSITPIVRKRPPPPTAGAVADKRR